MGKEVSCTQCGEPIKPQSDREVAEMIAKFRTPPGFNWVPLADDIECALSCRKEYGWPSI